MKKNAAGHEDMDSLEQEIIRYNYNIATELTML